MTSIILEIFLSSIENNNEKLEAWKVSFSLVFHQAAFFHKMVFIQLFLVASTHTFISS